MPENRRYIGFIGDLIGSREIKSRAQAQTALQEALNQVNARYQDCIASRLVITLGDEFQGLLMPSAPFLQMLDEIEARLLPYACRFGIGLGTMATAINPEMSIGADGEAFWLARAAITSVHDSDDYGKTRTRLRGASAATEPLINDLLALSDGMKRGWARKQQQTFADLLFQGIYQEDFDQTAAAKRMGITPEALYGRLKLSGIKTYLRSRANLQRMIATQEKREAVL
ncbi:MAG: DNA-binding protein [Clostridiales bacterium]|nr:DNA-binding protein [Clostridiales bacterium]